MSDELEMPDENIHTHNLFHVQKDVIVAETAVPRKRSRQCQKRDIMRFFA